jgi:hypothetical protein
MGACIVGSLRSAHEMNACSADDWKDYIEIWYERHGIEGYPKLKAFKFRIIGNVNITNKLTSDVGTTLAPLATG